MAAAPGDLEVIDGWVLTHYAKPFLMNHLVGMHRMEYHALHQEWLGAFRMLAAAARIPRGLPHIVLTVCQHYTSSVPPDPDAPAPAVKGAIDGLVRQGVVRDDGPAFVGPILYQLPKRAKKAALELTVYPGEALSLV